MQLYPLSPLQFHLFVCAVSVDLKQNPEVMIYLNPSDKNKKVETLTKHKQLYRGWSGAGRFTGVITAVMRLGTANITK